MSWLKLHRDLTAWRWYSDADTFRTFLHFLMAVHYESGEAWLNLDAVATALKLQKHRLEKSLNNLISTGEIVKLSSRKGKNGGVHIRVENWRKYQMGDGRESVVAPPTPPPVSVVEPPPASVQTFPFPTPKDPAEVLTAAHAAGLLFTPDMAQDFFDHYNAMGWTTNAGAIRNWRYKLRSWIRNNDHPAERPTAGINPDRKRKGI